jgi:hypothetical protein
LISKDVIVLLVKQKKKIEMKFINNFLIKITLKPFKNA